MTEQNQLIVRPNIISNFDDVARAATAMSKSGYFQDSRDQAQAIVRILAGQEMGFGAFSSMTGVHIIQGKPTVGANLMAAAVKGSGKYNYRVIEMTDKKCSIKYFEGKEEIGISTFTEEDAKKAGTKNMDKFPRNMLFARAMSNGVKWFCPDVFNGATVYTPEELGAEVDEDGNVIPKITITIPEDQPEQQKEPEVKLCDARLHKWPDGASVSSEMAQTVKDSKGNRYIDLPLDKLSFMFNAVVKSLKENGLTDEQRGEQELKRDTSKIILDMGI